MTHAELLRSHANLAIKEGGMYYSGEYLSGIATVAESLERENAKLRELVAGMYAVISDRNSWWDCTRKDTRRFADRMRKLGIEVDG